jgi:L-alanine-DL-glutamate epimerase-like enolase superfamily enzyme
MVNTIHDVTATAYRVPTDFMESDGTLEWNSTTLVLVEIKAAGQSGTGYTYADAALVPFIYSNLQKLILGQNPLDTGKLFAAMATAIRNEGHCGMAYMALSAVDTALWDLKAKILGLPLCRLVGMVRNDALIYGSGGFTSYPDERLANQLGTWSAQGIKHVKMKIGRHPDKDPARVRIARQAIGDDTSLFVDANGAYTVKQSLALAACFKEYGVTWFEEPVPSDDLPGLKFIRSGSPSGMNIAAGEYGYAPGYFLNMLHSEAVDVLQADATRCGGITGILKVGAMCEAFHIPFSFHCAPALHLHVALCVNPFYIGEYFHDHVRIEQMLFDGVQAPINGRLMPDLSKPGMGLDFKHKDAAGYKVG